jgi:tRNA(Arg) A34 adenosine deaminase TadA
MADLADAWLEVTPGATRNPHPTLGGDVYPTVKLELPRWIAQEVAAPDRRYLTLEERMAFVIHLAERNIDEGGGPFGAAVFEIETGRLVAPGVNLVVPLKCSLAHAEAMAIMVAQQVCGSHDLGAPSLPPMELVTSAQPCIQCYGNLWWSGLRRVVIGAGKHDVERLTGFFEGPLPEDWSRQLEHRPPLDPIEVVSDVLRTEACRVLQRYRDAGGPIYNPSMEVSYADSSR